MCTHARIPSPSRTTEIASSKSFAVSGSIVNETRSRRSVRPSSVASGSSCGSKPRRSPSWTRRASSTASTSSAFPSTCSSRARPRPGRSTARSPGPASRTPLTSTTIGVPGVKNGSPRSSFPRRWSSTTTGSLIAARFPLPTPLDLEEAAERQAGADGAEQKADEEQRERVPAEADRLHLAVGLETVENRPNDDRLAEQEQEDRREGPEDAADQPLDHERAAHEPVRRAHELHHLDLASAREDREADRVRDQQGRRDHEHDHGDEEERGDRRRDLDDAVGDLLAVAHLLHPGQLLVPDRVRDRAHVLRALRRDLERRGERIRREALHEVRVALLHRR